MQEPDGDIHRIELVSSYPITDLKPLELIHFKQRAQFDQMPVFEMPDDPRLPFELR